MIAADPERESVQARKEGRDAAAPSCRGALRPSRETAAVSDTRDRAAEGSLRVLIIEDHPDSAECLHLFVSVLGHDAALASDGVSGIDLARSMRPDVVICDIGLGEGIDGYAVARAIRADPRLAHVRLLALTGYAQPADEQRAMRAGFDAWMTKPADTGLLRGLLAEAAARKGARRDSRQDERAARTGPAAN